MCNYKYLGYYHPILIHHNLRVFDLLDLNSSTKIIFYASDPSKDQSQRYLTEKFLIGCFHRFKDFVLVIKTHPQDNGKITDYAYIDSNSPANVILIGDSFNDYEAANINNITNL